MQAAIAPEVLQPLPHDLNAVRVRALTPVPSLLRHLHILCENDGESNGADATQISNVSHIPLRCLTHSGQTSDGPGHQR